MRVRGVRRVLVVVEDHNQKEVMVKYQLEVLKDQYQLGGGQDQVQELVEDQELVEEALIDQDPVEEGQYLVGRHRDPLGNQGLLKVLLKDLDLVGEDQD